MAKEKLVQVTILNWEKFNPRKDIKASSWFRLEHSLFENPDFFDFTHAEVCTWLYLLCLASKKNVPTVCLHFVHAERIGRLSEKTIFDALEKLNKIKAITYKYVTYTSRTRDVSDTDTVRTRTLRDETNETNVYGLSYANAYEPVLVELYEIYPKRKGSQRKADGMRTLQKLIKQGKVDSVRKAIQNYSNHCQSEDLTGTERVLQFKTFVTSVWEEWIDKSPPNSFAPKTKEERIALGYELPEEAI